MTGSIENKVRKAAKKEIRFYPVFMAVVLIFLYAPIFLLILWSFTTDTAMGSYGAFTSANYREFFKDDGLIRLLGNSALIALTASAAATVFGTFAAFGISRLRGRMQRTAMMITNIPMTNPDIVTGISLALLFAFIGRLLRVNKILGFGTLLIAHVTFNLPYVILSVLPKIRQLDPHIREAALDLGATPAKAFVRVTLPELMPAIISGFITAFTMSLDDFVISYFVSGSSFTTLPVEIYTYTKKPIPQKVYALFTILFVAVLVMMIVMNIIEARDERRRKPKLRHRDLNS